MFFAKLCHGIAILFLSFMVRERRRAGQRLSLCSILALIDLNFAIFTATALGGLHDLTHPHASNEAWY